MLPRKSGTVVTAPLLGSGEERRSGIVTNQGWFVCCVNGFRKVWFQVLVGVSGPHAGLALLHPMGTSSLPMRTSLHVRFHAARTIKSSAGG
jgi:hypothetical protein